MKRPKLPSLPSLPRLPFLRSKRAERTGGVTEKKVYTLFAGVNGAGKTSLYAVLAGSPEFGERINIDEIVESMGSWRDKLIQLKATRDAMAKINDCIERGVNFHQETTLPTPTLFKQVKRARAAGFVIRLYFVGLDDIDVAIARVHARVEKGGHGIDDAIIRQRYEAMPGQIEQLLALTDEAVFFDNTLRFKQIAMIKNGVIEDCDQELPRWFVAMTERSADGGQNRAKDNAARQ